MRHISVADIGSLGLIGQGRVIAGVITFDGAGNYQFTGKLWSSLDSSSTATPWTYSGSYSVSENGFMEMTAMVNAASSFDGRDTLFAEVGKTAIVGSTTESQSGSFHDVFVAIRMPSGAMDVAKISGAYSVGTMSAASADALDARSALVTLQADGKGGLSAIQATGVAPSLGDGMLSQDIGGGSYTIAADGTGTLSFPADPDSKKLIGGDQKVCISADGSMILGGAENDFNLIVGVRAPTNAAKSLYQGVYFYAGLSIGLPAEPYTFSSWVGARRSTGTGMAYIHERLRQYGYTPYDSTYFSEYNLDANGRGGNEDSVYAVSADGDTLVSAGRRYRYLYVITRTRDHAPASAGDVFLHPYGILNAANFAPPSNPIAAGELVTLFGSNLASATQLASAPFPSEFAGVKVLINGLAAPIVSISPTQVSAIVPWSFSDAYASVKVVNNSRESNAVTMYTNAYAPGVFSLTQDGLGYGAALHPDYSVVTAGNPAHPNETIALFLTGLGAVKPSISDGAVGPTDPLSILPSDAVWIYVAGKRATVTYAGLAPGLAGLYQVNFTIPSATKAGDAYVDVDLGGAYNSQIAIPVGN